MARSMAHRRGLRDDARMEPSELLLLPRPRRIELLGGEGARRGTTPDSQLDRSLGEEAFTIEVAAGRIRVRFGGTSGRRYARQTLRQLRRQLKEGLPALRIEDAPDFPVRGLMLDVSRDRVPTRDTLEGLVHRMARLRLNHLELYTEAASPTRDTRRSGGMPHPSPPTTSSGSTLSATSTASSWLPTRTPSATWGAGSSTTPTAGAPRRPRASAPGSA
jgi:hypothetical protein